MTIQFRAERYSAELLQRARQDVCQALGTLCQYLSNPEKTLNQWAGTSLQPMKEDLTALLDALRHLDPQIRRAALFVVRDYWPELEEIISECLRVGFEDSDPLPRGIALSALSRFCGWIDDPSGVLDTVLWSYEDPEDPQAVNRIKAIKQANACHVMALQERHREWLELIGTQLDEMLRDRRVVECNMRSADSNLRYVAVAMMSCDWKPTQQVADIAETLAIEDSDPRVRKAAICVLIEYYADTKNKKLTKLLAEIVSDDRQPAEIRGVAYQGLFQVLNLPIETWPLWAMTPEQTWIFQNVDLAFVNSLR